MLEGISKALASHQDLTEENLFEDIPYLCLLVKRTLSLPQIDVHRKEMTAYHF
jgi:hypothetical protein